MSRVFYNYVQLPKCTEENVKTYVRECKKMYSTDTRITHKRIVPPTEWPSEFEKHIWEREQIEKCIKGDKYMCGKMYFYFNFCLIQNITGGSIKPQYRNSDAVWFQLIEQLQHGHKYEGYGMVCVKRRRCGASWKEACDAVHDALFNHSYFVGMDSKTEKDSFALLQKIKFIYDNLPSFLRVPLHGGKSRSTLIFARRDVDENGTQVLKGNMSTIFVVAPTDSAYEGSMLSKWVSDEAGKKDNLLTMWGLTIPCMMQEEKRMGIPIIFGTAGDIDKGSQGLEELWYKRDAYKLKPFFVPGWMGLMVDKYGNDDIYAAVKHILKTRKEKFDSGAADYFDYVQQFPLTIEEALLRKDQRGIGNTLKIDAQIEYLTNNPAQVTYGYMEEYGDDVVFRPSSESSPLAFVKIYEKPNKHWENAYVSGCDPADHDHVQNGSDLSIYILGKAKGSIPPRVVACMTYRPDRVEEFYEQAFMLLIWYNNTKVLIEKNRPGMIKYAKYFGYTYLLRREPTPPTKSKRKNRKADIGINKTTATGFEMERCINHFTTEYCDQILDMDLLRNFKKYGTVNVDDVIAFGWACVALEDDVNVSVEEQRTDKNLFNFGFKKINGKIVRYNN